MLFIQHPSPLTETNSITIYIGTETYQIINGDSDDIMDSIHFRFRFHFPCHYEVQVKTDLSTDSLQ